MRSTSQTSREPLCAPSPQLLDQEQAQSATTEQETRQLLAGHIKSLRQQRRLTQVQFAGIAGLLPRHINLLEIGEAPLGIGRAWAERIETALASYQPPKVQSWRR